MDRKFSILLQERMDSNAILKGEQDKKLLDHAQSTYESEMKETKKLAKDVAKLLGNTWNVSLASGCTVDSFKSYNRRIGVYVFSEETKFESHYLVPTHELFLLIVNDSIRIWKREDESWTYATKFSQKDQLAKHIIDSIAPEEMC